MVRITGHCCGLAMLYLMWLELWPLKYYFVPGLETKKKLHSEVTKIKGCFRADQQQFPLLQLRHSSPSPLSLHIFSPAFNLPPCLSCLIVMERKREEKKYSKDFCLALPFYYYFLFAFFSVSVDICRISLSSLLSPLSSFPFNHNEVTN